MPKYKIAKKVSDSVLVLPGLLKRLRGKTPAEDFYPKYGIRIATGKNWEYGVNTPKLEVLFGLCRMLGYDGMKELGYDLGALMDALRGDPDGNGHEAHHWLAEILREAPATVKEKVMRELRDLGGKYGKR